MEMSSALIYSFRFISKLALPSLIQENIAKLRIIPASYKPLRSIKPRNIRRKPEYDNNWREKMLVEYVKRVRETTDPNYDNIFEIFNKITSSSMKKLSDESITILKSQDEKFRLRVTTLLFDKAIKGSAYASVMADLANNLNNEIPEISEDLEIQVNMFSNLYDMNDTLVFPSVGDDNFDNKVIEWSKQKDVRRGYSRFLTQLYIRNLVSVSVLHSSMISVINDLETTSVQEKTDKTEEIITQYADFLYETAKLLPNTAVELRGLIQTRLGNLLSKSKTNVPSINMRSRFKLEDTQKCVQAT
jgi:hypothetical protein